MEQVVEPGEEEQEQGSGRDQQERRHRRPILVASLGEEAADRLVGCERIGPCPLDEHACPEEHDKPHARDARQPRCAHYPALALSRRAASSRSARDGRPSTRRAMPRSMLLAMTKSLGTIMPS